MQKYNLKMNKEQKNQVGITLIALVITVVIMLILAGVAIAAVVDGDGLFSKTRQAAETYENATRDEAKQMQALMNEIDDYLGEKENINPSDKKFALLSSVVKVGDYVDYDAGRWTSEDMAKIRKCK